MNVLGWHVLLQGREELLCTWLRNICVEDLRLLPPNEAHAFPERYQWGARIAGSMMDAHIILAP